MLTHPITRRLRGYVVVMLFAGLALASAGIPRKPAYILLIDTSGSMKSILPHLKSAAMDFISTLPDSTPVHLETFHEKGEPVLSVVLTHANRMAFHKALTDLRATGHWTHFAAAIEAIRSIKIDSSIHYKALIFTDQLGDPRPGFKDIQLDEIASHVPNNVEVYVISSSQALASIGSVDSTGFVTMPSGTTGVAADLKSSESIVDRLRDIAARHNIEDAIRPKRTLSTPKLLLLSLGGLVLLGTPILLQLFRRKGLRELTQTGGWIIALENGSQRAQEFVVYPNQRLIIGSAGNIKVATLPPAAAEFVCGKELRIKPHVEAHVNGQMVRGTTELHDGDRLVFENRIHADIRHMETRNEHA